MNVIINLGITTVVAISLFAAATDGWREAQRQDARHSVRLVEDVRLVYGDEAPSAFRVAQLEVRADELRRVRHTSQLAMSEYAAAAEAFDAAYGFQVRLGGLVGAAPYRIDGGGYDMARRLADIRAERPLSGEPDVTSRRADRTATVGVVAVLLGIVGVLVGAVVAIVRRPVGTWRRDADARAIWGASVGSSTTMAADISLIPQPSLAAPGRRRAVGLQLAAWVLLVLLPLGQLILAGYQQRDEALAQRESITINTALTIKPGAERFRGHQPPGRS